MDPHERRKTSALVRRMLPAPLIYAAAAGVYLALFDNERFFGPAQALTLAVVVGAAAPLWAWTLYRLAVARGRADARLGQALLVLAHGPGIAGLVLAAGTGQLWYALALGAEALAVLLFVRSKAGAG